MRVYDRLKQKTKLLDELLQLEQTAQIIRSAGGDDTADGAASKVPQVRSCPHFSFTSGQFSGLTFCCGICLVQSPIDACYSKLKCGLEVLPAASPEYQLIAEMLTYNHKQSLGACDMYGSMLTDCLRIQKDSW